MAQGFQLNADRRRTWRNAKESIARTSLTKTPRGNRHDKAASNHRCYVPAHRRTERRSNLLSPHWQCASYKEIQRQSAEGSYSSGAHDLYARPGRGGCDSRTACATRRTYGQGGTASRAKIVT